MLRTIASTIALGVVIASAAAQPRGGSPEPLLLQPYFPTSIDDATRDHIQLVQGTSNPNSPPADSSGDYDNGNDPSKIRKRFTFRTDSARFANGLTVTTTIAQAAFPILQEEKLKANFGFDVPINHYDVKQPLDTTFDGIGDLKANIIFVRPLNPMITAVFGSNLYFPTAAQSLLELPTPGRFTSVNLGTGKYRLEPLAGLVFFLSKNLFVIPFYAHDMSFAGDESALGINRGTARLFVNSSLPQGYYVSSESQFLINFKNDNDLDAFQRIEIGKAFKNGTVFYVKPGVGIAPGPFNREWGIEAGLRFVF